MPTKYAHKRIRQGVEAQVRENKNTLQSKADLPRREEFEAKVKRDEGILVSMTPPDVQGESRKILESRQAKIIDSIRAGKGASYTIPTEMEMKSGGASAEDKHRVWENFVLSNKMDERGKVVRMSDPAHEQSLFDEFKDNARTLGKADEDDLNNVANIETIRPQGYGSGGSRLIDFPRAQFGMPNIDYSTWVFQNLEAWPPYNGVKMGGYAPFFEINEATGELCRTDMHPKGAARKAGPASAQPSAKEVISDLPAKDTGGWTRCQAVGKVSGKQCKHDTVSKDKPYCHLESHRAKFEIAAPPVTAPSAELQATG